MLFPVRGRAGGGGDFGLTCPAGHGVIGYGGRGGLLLDQLFLHCAELVVDGAQVLPGERVQTDRGGGNGGAPFADVFCPMGTFATAGIIRAGDGVDAMGIACAPLTLMD